MSSMHDLVQRLVVSAVRLNKASDDFRESITSVEGALKKLNLGIEQWCMVEMPSQTIEVGYAKMIGKWSLAIRNDEDEWTFNEAPRVYRIVAVDAIPRLLDAIRGEADRLADEAEKRTHEVRESLRTLGASA